MWHEKCFGGCVCYKIGKVLLIIGGLNWGLVGLGMLMNSDWNVVKIIFGSIPTLEAIIYVLVGFAAIMNIFGCCCKKCKEGQAACCGNGGEENMDKKI
jgi:uncharacterized protein